MRQRLFIGRRVESKCLAHIIKPLDMPIRDIVVLIGPHGVGKTSIARYILSKYYGGDEYTCLYINLSRSYVQPSTFIYDLLDQFRDQLRDRYSVLKNVLISVLSGLTGTVVSRLTGLNVDEIIREISDALVGKGVRDLYYLFDRSLEALSHTIGGEGYGLIVIDELQNLLKTVGGKINVSVLVKRFMDLEEHVSSGRVRFLLVTSDYGFYNDLLIGPYMEYIRSFYLGEMCRDDVFKLFTELLELRGIRYSVDYIDKYMDIVGGTPSIVYEIVSRLSREAGEDMLRKAISTLYRGRNIRL